MAKSLSSRIAAAAAPKGMLGGLEFVDNAPGKPFRTAVPVDPKQRVRERMLRGIATQIAAAEALTAGREYKPTREVPVKGQRGVKETKPARFSPWFWQAADGVFYTIIKYGTRQVMVMEGKPIKVGSVSQLKPVLEVIAEAVNAGELDDDLMAIASKMGRKRA